MRNYYSIVIAIIVLLTTTAYANANDIVIIKVNNKNIIGMAAENAKFVQQDAVQLQLAEPLSACSSLSSSTPSTALIAIRGNCTFSTKLRYAMESGAEAL